MMNIPRKTYKDAVVTKDAVCSKCENKFMLAYPLTTAVKFHEQFYAGQVKCEKCGEVLIEPKPKSSLILPGDESFAYPR
jgi:formylmethanofuran dehydrogenase subunit E